MKSKSIYVVHAASVEKITSQEFIFRRRTKDAIDDFFQVSSLLLMVYIVVGGMFVLLNTLQPLPYINILPWLLPLIPVLGWLIATEFNLYAPFVDYKSTYLLDKDSREKVVSFLRDKYKGRCYFSEQYAIDNGVYIEIPMYLGNCVCEETII